MSDPVGNSEDRFSHNEAHLMFFYDTVNQLIFAAIIFCLHGHFHGDFFCRLQNWTIQEQCKVCLYGLFTVIYCPYFHSHEYREN